VRWAKDHAVQEVLGLGDFDEDNLYAALDWLAAKQDKIETQLYKLHTKQKGQPPALVLYDVTSSYFEGEKNELAAFGYNRDGKKGKRQIVIGLLTDPEGEPLAVEVFQGNSSDPTTVASQVSKLVERFHIRNVVFVGDRGMIKAKGKEVLAQQSFQYITAMTDPQVRKLLKSNIIQPGLFDESIAEVCDGERRYVLRRDEVTQRKEQHRRDSKLRRLGELIEKRNLVLASSLKASPEKALKAIQAWSIRHKISSFAKLTLTERTLACDIDIQAKDEDALLDGCYVLETDVPANAMTKDQIDARYRDLQKVERDFRAMKTGLLEVRPIFVRKAERTKAHVFLSMLALKVTRVVEGKLRARFGSTNQKPHALTLGEALTALSRLCLNRYTIGEENIFVLPGLDERQSQIAASLGVQLELRRKRTS
jgi:transposase